MKYFPWIAIAFVAIVAVTAFFLIGSPAHQRLVRFDERRLSDLQSIRYEIPNYFETKGHLPATLADMKGSESFSSIPVDPETGTPYEYAVKGEMQFQLCASFALASDDGENAPYGKGPTSENWRHPAGRGCFDITLELPISGPKYPRIIKISPAV